MPGGSGSRDGKAKGAGRPKGAGAAGQQLSGAALAEAAKPYNEQLKWIVSQVLYARMGVGLQYPNPNANAGVAGTRGGSRSLFEMPKCFQGMGVLMGTEQGSLSAASGVKLRIKVKLYSDILVHIKWVAKTPSQADAWRSSGNTEHEQFNAPSMQQKIAAWNSTAAATGGAQAGYDAKASAAAGGGAYDAKATAAATTPAAASTQAPPQPVKISLLHLAPPTVAAAAHATANTTAPQPPAPAAATAPPPPHPSVAAQVHAAHAAAAPQAPTVRISLGPKNNWS